MPVPVDDLAMRPRVNSIAAGVWPTFALAVAGVLYAALTSGSPHRLELAVVFALAAIGALVILLLPAERIVASRWREVWFVGWSVLDIALITATVALDGGVGSPMAFAFVFPVAFACLSYPRGPLLAVTALDIAAFVGLGIVASDAGAGTVLYGSAALAALGLLCALQTRIANRERGALSLISRADPLTSCLNRRGFEGRLAADLTAAERTGSPLALVIVDLDHFKSLNDTHGHAYGDEVLRGVGERLRAVVREGDAVARLGGEEFALLLPAADADLAVAVAERARAAVAVVPARDRALSCSAGVALFPTDAPDGGALMDAADAALYAAKRTGRDRTRRFDPNNLRVAPTGAGRAEVEALLARPAGVTSAYQPLVDLATGRVAGYEALARFDDQGRRSPDRWFAHARSCGYGPELEARALLAALSGTGRPHGTFLCLNVSPEALTSPVVRAALPADLHDLVIEVTEHDLVSGGIAVEETLAELRLRGARIAVDDVGVGHAGLAQVMRLRPDLVKLDRSLVAGLDLDPGKVALVESFVRFARRVGAAVCAEGIEREEELTLLAELDVTYGQGFALGRPSSPWVTPPAATAETLRRRGLGSGAGVQGFAELGDRRLEEIAGRLARLTGLADLEEALLLVAAELGAEAVSFSRWVPEHDRLDTVMDTGGHDTDLSYCVGDFPTTRQVLASGDAVQVLVRDPASDPTEVTLLLRNGYGSLLMVPVPGATGTVGLLEIGSARERPWTRTEMSRTRIVAALLGGVLERTATPAPAEPASSLVAPGAW